MVLFRTILFRTDYTRFILICQSPPAIDTESIKKDLRCVSLQFWQKLEEGRLAGNPFYSRIEDSITFRFDSVCMQLIFNDF